MQIAAEHAEAVGARTRIGVEERLLLDRIALHAADVAPRHAQPSALVEANLADADRAFGQRAAVPARVAAQPAVGQHVVELALAGLAREHISKCGPCASLTAIHCSQISSRVAPDLQVRPLIDVPSAIIIVPHALILVTNDDGYRSEGISLLADALAPLGDVTIVAPIDEASAIGHALTLRRPLRLEHIREGMYAVDGTPTDCVNMAVTQVFKRLPDLVVSGINKGWNLGDDVTYSGTVAGALEGGAARSAGPGGVARGDAQDVRFQFLRSGRRDDRRRRCSGVRCRRGRF